jgi:hypothetical protein
MGGGDGSYRPQVCRLPVKPGRAVPRKRGAWARRCRAAAAAARVVRPARCFAGRQAPWTLVRRMGSVSPLPRWTWTLLRWRSMAETGRERPACTRSPQLSRVVQEARWCQGVAALRSRRTSATLRPAGRRCADSARMRERVGQARGRTCGEKKRRPREPRRMEAGARPAPWLRGREESAEGIGGAPGAYRRPERSYRSVTCRLQGSRPDHAWGCYADAGGRTLTPWHALAC